jgi:hypothetical protein
MDLDSLRQKSAKVSAPPIDVPNVTAGTSSIDDLIALLQASDEAERRKIRKSLPLFAIAAVVFTVAFIAVLLPIAGVVNSSALLLRGILAVLYLSLLLVFWTRMRGIAKIDYAEPVSSFLAKAERRYAFGSRTSYVLAFIATLFLGYVAYFYVSDVAKRYFDINDSSIGLLVTLLFFTAVYAFGLWATRKDWKKEKGEIWLQIRMMRDELEREEANGNS